MKTKSAEQRSIEFWSNHSEIGEFKTSEKELQVLEIFQNLKLNQSNIPSRRCPSCQ
jgi:hypothetical protein